MICIVMCLIIGGVRCDFFFFFKQKTAYEMRISDWSSDVCSSDLYEAQLGRPFGCAAQYTAVPSINAVGLSDAVSYEQGACLGVPALTAHYRDRKSVV